MKKKKSKKGKPYHLTLNIEGEPVVVEVKKFSDWLKNRDKNLKKERKIDFHVCLKKWSPFPNKHEKVVPFPKMKKK